MSQTIQSSRKYTRVTSKEIFNSHARTIIRILKRVFRNLNIKLIIDGGDQGIGKTTHWIRISINNNWITIVFASTHYKTKEILKDLEISEETAKKTIKPKLKYHTELDTLRVHTIFGKFWELNKNDWYVCPWLNGKTGLCSLKNDDSKTYEILKQGHLGKYCYKRKPINNTYPRCKNRYDCDYNKQFDKIIAQIKGNTWQLLEEEIRKIKYNKKIGKEKQESKIKKLQEKIEVEKLKRKEIHHLIILPHIYMFLETIINTLFNIFKDEINSLVDENPINLMFNPVNITHKRLKYEINFLRKKLKKLRREGVDLQIYKQFLPIIIFLYNSSKYNNEELNKIKEFKQDIEIYRNNNDRQSQIIKRQDLEKYRNHLDTQKTDLLLRKLIEFANSFNEKEYEQNYNNYIRGIIKMNERRLDAIKIPNNIFTIIFEILSEINKNEDKNILKNRISMDIRTGSIEFLIDKRPSIYNIIENCKNFIIFMDATAEKDIYKKVLVDYEDPLIFIPRENISNYTIYGFPINGKLNAKYQLWDPEREDFLENGFELINHTAWLIKENRTKKLMIALFKDFNNWKKEEEKYNGKFMITLGRVLKLKYNINIKDLDIKLGFWYSEGGKNIFEDREIQIQFGCPGIPSRATKNKMGLFTLSKNEVDIISIHKEQEQMAGRTRSFLHGPPIKIFLLTSNISPYFKEKENIRNLRIVLKYLKLLNYIQEYGPVTTEQIQQQWYPDKNVNEIRFTLKNIEKTEIGLIRSHNSPYVWYFKD